jgi:hypothetical protein
MPNLNTFHVGNGIERAGLAVEGDAEIAGPGLGLGEAGCYYTK